MPADSQSTTQNRGETGVSVVIPAYNYARYLGEAIDSALAQDYEPKEIVVVDDGSTDDTAMLVKGYGAAVRYLHQDNAGLSAARNTGIDRASHPYIALLDADDLWLPGKLTETMAAFRGLGPDYGIVASAGRKVDQDGAPLPGQPSPNAAAREIRLRDVLVRTRFCPSSAVVRRECFARCGGFDTELRSSEDRDMWIRIGRHWRIHWLPQPLVSIRCHSHNMSRHADRMKSNMSRVVEQARAVADETLSDTRFWRRVRAFLHYQTSWMYFEEGRRGAAVRDLLKSLWISPVYSDPAAEAEPPLFRLRSLRRFLFSRLP